MHTAALTIRTDAQTKQRIAAFAASIGMSTSAFATAVLLQAVRDNQVTFTPEPLTPTPELEAIMRRADRDLAADRNVSPVFDTASAMFEHLEKQL